MILHQVESQMQCVFHFSLPETGPPLSCCLPSAFLQTWSSNSPTIGACLEKEGEPGSSASSKLDHNTQPRENSSTLGGQNQHSISASPQQVAPAPDESAATSASTITKESRGTKRPPVETPTKNSGQFSIPPTSTRTPEPSPTSGDRDINHHDSTRPNELHTRGSTDQAGVVDKSLEIALNVTEEAPLMGNSAGAGSNKFADTEGTAENPHQSQGVGIVVEQEGPSAEEISRATFVEKSPSRTMPGDTSIGQNGGPKASKLVGLDIGVSDAMETIDWEAALEQCSGDQAFLEELLVDLWTESGEHTQQLREVVASGKSMEVQHEAHSIKGAAANLMCHRLRTAALYLEKAGFAGTKVAVGTPDHAVLRRATVAGMEILEEEIITFERLLKEKKLM